mmetsp:Transcript_7916/g.29544  ORF Transcript_7916/g.29544 Transcript_7916/m.29544 type:complete len:82 (-) Transcript_7916:1594-1839(-)
MTLQRRNVREMFLNGCLFDKTVLRKPQAQCIEMASFAHFHAQHNSTPQLTDHPIVNSNNTANLLILRIQYYKTENQCQSCR